MVEECVRWTEKVSRWWEKVYGGGGVEGVAGGIFYCGPTCKRGPAFICWASSGKPPVIDGRGWKLPDVYRRSSSASNTQLLDGVRLTGPQSGRSSTQTELEDLDIQSWSGVIVVLHDPHYVQNGCGGGIYR